MSTTVPAAHRDRRQADDRNPFASAQYRWWWGMTFATSLAIGVQLVTVPTYVLDRTDTRFLVAVAVLCQTVPTALFTLIGGAWADRFGRGVILRVTLAVTAASVLALFLLSLAEVAALWPVFAVAAVLGTSAAFQNPARQSLINLLAPGSRLQNGVIWGTLAFMGGQAFLGPTLAGFAVDAFGLTAGFALAVALLAAAIVCALRLRGVDGVTPARGSLLTQIGDGLRYVRGEARLWQVLVLGAVPGLCYMGVTQPTFPIFSTETFDQGARGIGLLNGGMGAGVLAGSILLARWGPRTRRGLWFLAALPIGGIGFTLAGVAPTFALAVGILVLWGLGAALFINFASTLLQTYAAPAYIGRVMSIYSLCVMGAVPLGNLHAGIGLQFTDPRVVIVYSGFVSVIFGVLALLRLRAVRALD
jgi:MFS family permease